MKQLKPEFHWCRTASEAGVLSRLFSSNLNAPYISHSELQGRRAISPGVWSPDIAEQIDADVLSRIDNPLDAAADAETSLVVAATFHGCPAGVFLITFSRKASVPCCIIEDMIVDPDHRGQGIGSAFMGWINCQCRDRSITRLFLESGIDNEHAHDFFDATGFRKISVVMMKELIV